MKKNFPCVEIDLKKITHNTKVIIELCKQKDIHVVGVSKVFCAKKPVVQAMINGGIEIIGDSRLENLKKLELLNCRKMLLRIPMESSASEVVKYSDISLNSEIDTVKLLSKAAKRMNKIHHIILMVDLGDLREGVSEEETIKVVKEIMSFPNIKLCGLGTNLTCYGGIIPDSTNLGRLLALKENISSLLGINLPIVSGGNSSSLHLVIDGSIPRGINQLRIGEAIVLGRETAYGNSIENTYRDAFVLKGEIIEMKSKPSVPKGKIGMDAFGQVPIFTDKGTIKRAIIAIGRQDIVPEGLTPGDKNLEILGASSDHLIVNLSNSAASYKVGDIVDFYMDYGCLLRTMTSPYVRTYYKN
jgi:predicted amino acid racemase